MAGVDLDQVPDTTPWAIPPEALQEWLTLAAVVDEIGPVPCESSDADAWWPVRSDAGGFGTRMALDGCSVCGARDTCLAYALAADEREGIWGATLPHERRVVRLVSVGREAS